MSPIITSLHYSYKKKNSDVWVLNTNDIPVEKNVIKDVQLVHLAPHSKGGNHSHPRTEWFIGMGDLEFVWLDEHGVQHREVMHPHGELVLIEVPPHLPHAVYNASDTQFGLLYEMADGVLEDVVEVSVL